MLENKRIVFISDIHLSPEFPERTRKFISFLNSLKGNTAALYILGDLFDFWIGEDHLKLQEHKDAISALNNLSKSGVLIFFIKGNRDFYTDKKLEWQSGMKILGENHSLSLDGTKIFLTHGDTIAIADKLYPTFRRLSRSKICAGIFGLLPAKTKYRLAAKARKTSMDINAGKKHSGIVKNKAAAVFRKGFDVIICGHIHKVSKLKLETNGLMHAVYTLGDWNDTAPYLQYSGGVFRNLKFEI
ncbi:MAG: UDP-2,3-diacylglucosamine diphosphatase [Planctomycetes bacterium]|nr:UDP-2,3-diacylglucosamine diphosphatase [Planctomycetota bacterium]